MVCYLLFSRGVTWQAAGMEISEGKRFPGGSQQWRNDILCAKRIRNCAVLHMKYNSSNANFFTLFTVVFFSTLFLSVLLSYVT